LILKEAKLAQVEFPASDRLGSQTGRRAFLKLLGGSLAFALTGGLLDACSPSPAASPTSPAVNVTPSPATGKLSVYSALNDKTNSAFIDAFQKANPGITVALFALAAAGDLENRIIGEKGAPQGDIFLGGSSEFHQPLGEAKLLEAYKSPLADDLDFKDPFAFWTGWYLGIFGLVINVQQLGGLSMAVARPKSWDDLLDPAWRGKLVVPDPVKTGGGYIFLATQVFRFQRDEDKAMDYMRKLHRNVAEYVPTSPQGIDLVAQGKYPANLNWCHDILTAKNQGQPLEMIIPQPTGFEVGAVSIIKGGPNTAAARTFVDWVLSKQAGELNVKLSNRLSVRKDVPPAPGAPTLASVSLVNYDRDWATTNKDRLIKRWQAAIAS
jgi:iron(III) transport system substrate-binding protein